MPATWTVNITVRDLLTRTIRVDAVRTENGRERTFLLDTVVLTGGETQTQARDRIVALLRAENDRAAVIEAQEDTIRNWEAALVTALNAAEV